MTVASDLAGTLLTSLTNRKDIDVPNIDVTGNPFNQPDNSGEAHTSITKFEPENLTAGEVGGDGIFDKLMASLVAHLKTEFSANRISGAEYTKAYQAIVAQALQTSLSFLMSRDQVYWQTLLAKKQAQQAEVQLAQGRVELETARVMNARAKYEAETAAAQYAAAQMQVALLDAQYRQTEAEIANLGKQGQLIDSQISISVVDKATKEYELANTLPTQKELIVSQTDLVKKQIETADLQKIGIGYDNAAKTYTNENILPQQKLGLEKDNATKAYQLSDLLPAQKGMIVAQTANADADKQLKDYQRTDILPAQKLLYEEQRQSYVKDAMIKTAKMWSDVFITLKTMDIAITADQFNSANMDSVLSNLRQGIAI